MFAVIGDIYRQSIGDQTNGGWSQCVCAPESRGRHKKNSQGHRHAARARETFLFVL